MEASIEMVAAEPGSGHQSLREQARGHGRDYVMKHVVGPAFDSYYRPVYDVPLTHQEAARLPAITTFGDLEEFSQGLVGVLNARITEKATTHPDEYQEIDELNRERPDLFYFGTTESVLRDGLVTDVVVPLTVAAHIYRLENSADLPEKDFEILETGFDQEAIIAIMQRPSFDRILQHFTKGPFGFLGGNGSALKVWASHLFDFKTNNWETARQLMIQDAYKMEDGVITDLSDAYHIAAKAKRQQIGVEYRATFMSRGGDSHEPNNSSGCPVRHHFVDEDGEMQDTLISTGKDFLIAALQANQVRPVSVAMTQPIFEPQEPETRSANWLRQRIARLVGRLASTDRSNA